MDRSATSWRHGRTARALGLCGSVVVVFGCTATDEVVVKSGSSGVLEAKAKPGPGPEPVREVKLPVAHVAKSAEPEEPPQPEANADDPRVVPPGTSAPAARAFQRLPVAIHDGPPLGGIGASGIHVDKIWLGTEYDKDGCAHTTNRFSLANGDRVNVCFRVVHPREEESVEVEWIKEGAVFRRQPVSIPDLHAYRSRAYLVLRREYIGAWQARVRSADGEVLATIDFSVTE